MDSVKPLRKEGILSRQLGDETVLYDSENGDVHIINTMAEFVWNLCDGSHSLDDIELRIRETSEVPEGTPVREDLDKIIQSFSNLGVLA